MLFIVEKGICNVNLFIMKLLFSVVKEVFPIMYATTTSVFTSESSLTSWWETTVWIVSERHWLVLRGSHEILENRVL